MADDTPDRALATLGGSARAPLSPQAKRLYLETLASSGSLTKAAEVARPGVKKEAALRYFEELARGDQEFAQARRDALVAVQGALESMLTDHAVNGWEEPVFGKTKDGTTDVIGHVTKFDHKLSLTVVRRNARILGDDSWEDKKVVEHTGGQTVEHQISMRDLPQDIRSQLLAARKKLLAAKKGQDDS